jgi:hypothetical protein
MSVRRRRVCLILAALALGAVSCPGAGAAGDGGSLAATTVEADLVGAANPQGLLLTAGAFRRWTREGGDATLPPPYFQAGFGVGSSPAYAKAAVHVEWLPHPAFRLRTQYALSRYYGTSGALLSFPAGDAPFGQRDVDARAGAEQRAWGQRVLVQPTLRFTIGPVLVRNVTDLAYCRFDGRGPYFLEWEYDTLVKDGDWVVSDSLQALVKGWSGAGAAALYAGPFFEITRAGSAGITQQRAGLLAAWTVTDRSGWLRRPRVYLQAGVHLRDPNREGGIYGVLGAGFDLDLN